MSTTDLDKLPSEVVRNIASRLEWRDRVQLQCTTRALYRDLVGTVPPAALYPRPLGLRATMLRVRMSVDPIARALGEHMQDLLDLLSEDARDMRMALCATHGGLSFKESGIRWGGDRWRAIAYVPDIHEAPCIAMVEKRGPGGWVWDTRKVPGAPDRHSRMCRQWHRRCAHHLEQLWAEFCATMASNVAHVRETMECAFGTNSTVQCQWRGVQWTSALNRLLIEPESSTTHWLVSRPSLQCARRQRGWCWMDFEGAPVAKLHTLRDAQRSDIREALGVILMLGLLRSGRHVDVRSEPCYEPALRIAYQEVDLSEYFQEIQRSTFPEVAQFCPVVQVALGRIFCGIGC